MKEYFYKILVVGDLGTGKTSILKRYVEKMFSTRYKSTVRYFSLYISETSLTHQINRLVLTLP
jgi:GTPase SAR1 family protein